MKVKFVGERLKKKDDKLFGNIAAFTSHQRVRVLCYRLKIQFRLFWLAVEITWM